MDFGFAHVGAIVILAYIVGEVVKMTKIDHKNIPAICAVSGIILGLLAFYLHIPDMPAVDPITAAAIGGSSGIAATGVNQLYKKMSGK